LIVIATSDKGGTGRSVTGSNVVYRRALQGGDVCYVDFDFGSPTAGAIFGISALSRGTTTGKGTHSYLLGRGSDHQGLGGWP
jgi:MinD-like ATPase involved in chromosome partitioning or flagellar assembly